VQGETARLRDQFNQVGDRFEERVEGWLEEPPREGDNREWPEQPQDRRRPRSRDYGANDSDPDPWI
jgi:hypothetical protein